jgi:hypothetical protein
VVDRQSSYVGANVAAPPSGEGKMTEQVLEKIVPVADKRGNTFEAYELRCSGKSIFIDCQIAERCGGIERVREGIAPYHMIVMEMLK